MNITFYQFVKRENSTAQPGVGVTSKTYDCKLKEDTSIIEPSILIVKEAAQNYTDLLKYNYAYISDFGRYYFVRNVISVSNVLVEFILEVDSLASFKTEIGSANEYVLRSASSYDGDITDDLYPAKGIVTHAVNQSTGVPFALTDIGYVIGSINNETTNKFGAVQYYLMDGTNIGLLMQYLLGQNLDVCQDTESLIIGLSVEIQNGIARALANPAQYLVDSYAIPYASKLSVDSSATVKTGYWVAPAAGSPLLTNYSIAIDSGTIDLAQHPQAATRGNYLNGSPYTRHWLCLGPFGIYALDASRFINAHQVEYSVSGDQFGNVRCDISCQGARIDRLFANVKCPFPLAQVSVDAFGAAQSAIAMTEKMSGISAGKEDTPYGGLASIVNFANSLMPQVTRSGSQGSMTGIFGNFLAVSEFLEVVDDDLAQRGRPLCQKVQISSLSGYILVSDPDIAISGTAEENTRIKSYMANGFFYE